MVHHQCHKMEEIKSTEQSCLCTFGSYCILPCGLSFYKMSINCDSVNLPFLYFFYFVGAIYKYVRRPVGCSVPANYGSTYTHQDLILPSCLFINFFTSSVASKSLRTIIWSQPSHKSDAPRTTPCYFGGLLKESCKED
jgi:hypothetical protein